MLTRRLEWTFIASCTACVAVVLAAGTAGSIGPKPPVVVYSGQARADAAPQDFSDPTIRSAILGHERSLRDDGMPSLAEHCGQSDEAYRAQTEPGHGGNIDWRIVDASVTGNEISVVERHVATDPSPGRRGLQWRQRFAAERNADRLAPVRTALDETLRAAPAGAIGDWIVDAARVYVEACRNGRYYYFERAGAGEPTDEEVRSGSGRARILRLANAVLRLADRRTPARR